MAEETEQPGRQPLDDKQKQIELLHELNSQIVGLMVLMSGMVDLSKDGEKEELIATSDIFLDACSEFMHTLYQMGGVTHDDVYGENKSDSGETPVPAGSPASA